MEVDEELAMGLAGDMTVLYSESGQSLETVLKNIKHINRIAFDIGQTLVKLAYSSTVAKRKTTHQRTLVSDNKDVRRMNCIQIRIEDFEEVLDYIANFGHISNSDATFSSTYSTKEYEHMIEQKLGLRLHKINEMDCLVRGTNFLIRNIEAESFTYDHHNDFCRYKFETYRPQGICPYLLVNVGTGISVFRVDNDTTYERVGGSSLGGGAFFGIAHQLTEELGLSMNFDLDLDHMLQMAEDGDHRQFDILVSDIYGGKYEHLGLSGDLIAGSFGKCTNRENVEALKKTPDYKKNVVRSLLLMISNSIGQLAYLYSVRENTKRIYFDGFLIRNHAIIMRTISYAIGFWSKGSHHANFLRHEGYTTALGAFLKGDAIVNECNEENGIMEHEDTEKFSWRESYTGCSELGRFVPTAPLSAGFTAGMLEMECADILLQPFPLLNEKNKPYKPDEVDLNNDQPAREFWMETMEQSVAKVMTKAIESQAKTIDAEDRAEIFRDTFTKQIQIIEEKPFAYGNSNVRNLLDLREQILNEQEFDDSFLNQKTTENNQALSILPSILSKLDEVSGADERLFLVSKGLLAGNVFDWGAKEVITMMESKEGLSFQKAVDTIQERPWLVDCFDLFAKSINEKHYKCAVIFVDNSGADFVLGVIPFARELIKRGTKVIIVSNLTPALNDLTFGEMISMIPRLIESDSLLKTAIQSDKLMFQHSGHGSPCLDLRKVHSKLNAAVMTNDVDLVVLEGMGRTLHTNLNAQFTCDSLKAAVIKTQWLADRMGGKIFSVVFKFERAEDQVEDMDCTPAITE